MYRILIADDEGIMLESLRTTIGRSFEDCEVETAKTGRTAIERAEYFRPDIILMDIQMPGINGIEAMKEIRCFNKTALVYIISAYDKFEYAKEAIGIGVEGYIMKPVTKKTVIEVITGACARVDELRQKKSEQLRTQEKLETIVPIVESGFISNMLLQEDWQEAGYYKQLLDITEDNGYVLLFRFGILDTQGRLDSPVGVNVKIQSMFLEFRAVVKSFLRCLIGLVGTNRIVVAVPRGEASLDYDARIAVIENARQMTARLEERLRLNFRAGIGRVRPLEELKASYLEAVQALRESDEQVVHISDIISRGEYEDGFPIELEHTIFALLGQGKLEPMKRRANQFFDWMVRRYPTSRDNIRLKVLEYVLAAEKDAFHEGAVNYGFDFRENYLTEVMAIEDYETLRDWFIGKMSQTCLSIHDRKEQQSESVVSRAKSYMQEHFQRDISLDDVSREVNISPYYFSKLFKEEAGENFIDYLTGLRIERAKELLGSSARSIKEISYLVGYTDPNYFSRIFKKQTQQSPREYREEHG